MISLESNICFYLVVAAFYLYAFVSCLTLARSNKTADNNQEGGRLTQGYTGLLKGILAINIILCHFAARADNLVLPYRMIGLLGGPSVAVFLCISGYAETYVMDHKGIQKYFDGFLLKKIFRIYFPWIISVGIIALMYGINNADTIIQGLFTFRTIYRDGTYNWFVIIILYYYLGIWLYGLVAKKLKWKSRNNTFLIWIFVFSIVWFAVCYGANMDSHWYGNSFSMFFGCLIGQYYKELANKLNNHKLRNLIVFAILSVMFVGMATVFRGIPKVVSRLTSTLFICLLTLQLSQFISKGNKVLEFLGSMSLEMFYMGTGVFLWYYSRFPAEGWSVFPIFAMIIILSYLIKVLTDVTWKKALSPLLGRK